MNEGRLACGHGDMGTGPHQVLAATLMLFQPGGAYYAHPLLKFPQGAWNLIPIPVRE